MGESAPGAARHRGIPWAVRYLHGLGEAPLVPGLQLPKLGLEALQLEQLGPRTLQGGYLRERIENAAKQVNVNELRLGFSNTTRNPEGILSHNTTG